MKGPVYRDSEIEFLMEHLTEFPPVILARRFQLEASKQGLPSRSIKALYEKIRQLLQENPDAIAEMPEDFLSLTQWAEVLKVSRHTVEAWVKKKGLTAPRHKGASTTRKTLMTYRTVSRFSLCSFLKANPDQARKCSEEALFWLFESREKVRELKDSPRNRIAGIKVRRVKDGRVFNSISQAAKTVPITSPCLKTKIGKGVECGGSEWEYAN